MQEIYEGYHTAKMPHEIKDEIKKKDLIDFEVQIFYKMMQWNKNISKYL